MTIACWPMAVTIATRAVGSIFLISLSAARPSISGMVMSISTASGRHSAYLLDRLEAVFGLCDLVAVVRQHLGGAHAHEGRVVDHQYSCHVVVLRESLAGDVVVVV